MKSYLVTFALSRIWGSPTAHVVLDGSVELYADSKEEAIKKALAKGYIPHPDGEDKITVWEIAK